MIYGGCGIFLATLSALSTVQHTEADVHGKQEILTVPQHRDWYENTVIYEIYPRSFKDSNGDGIGDIKGIHEKLDYLHSLGVETLWIQTFFKSPMVDFGYDVTDFREIEPIFGTMDDFKDLVKAIHNKGMKLLVDFIPNHTSDESEWFKKSIERDPFYKDFYIWVDPKGYDSVTMKPVPPNNWLSVFGGPAWTWNEKRKQFYFRKFTPGQPDLNFRNQKVKTAMEDVLRFWLDIGVDGFRVDAIPFLVEDKHLRDDPWKSPDLVNSTEHRSQVHLYSLSQPETYEICHEWRLLLDQYKQKDGRTRIMTLETHQGIDKVMEYFGNETYKGHLPLYFGFIGFNFLSNATVLDNIIHAFMDKLPANGVPNWVVSNHDVPRFSYRINPEFSDAMMMIELMLPGVASIYYGDEIGMLDVRLRPDQRQDIKIRKEMSEPNRWSRDWARTPMQWDDTRNSGFSSARKPWLPVSPDYWRRNVKQQERDPHSHLNSFKRLMQLRRSPVGRDGTLTTCVVSPWIHMLVRALENEPPLVVIVNVGSEDEVVCAKRCSAYSLPNNLLVHTASDNSGFITGKKFSLSDDDKSPCSILRQKAGVVLSTVVDPPPNHSARTSFFPSLLILSVISSFAFRS